MKLSEWFTLVGVFLLFFSGIVAMLGYTMFLLAFSVGLMLGSIIEAAIAGEERKKDGQTET